MTAHSLSTSGGPIWNFRGWSFLARSHSLYPRGRRICSQSRHRLLVDDVQAIVVVYVDDLLLTCTELIVIKQTFTHIATLIKNEGPVHSYLDMKWDFNETPDLGIALQCNNVKNIQAFIDPSYATHPDFRSHTGMVISVGAGPIDFASTEQKVNTKYSAEAELIAQLDKAS